MAKLHREINLNLQQIIKHGYSSDLEFLHQVCDVFKSQWIYHINRRQVKKWGETSLCTFL